MPAAPQQPLLIEIFSDYIWPWCYLSTVSIEKLQANYPVTLRWVHFPLHPDTPAAGLALADLFKGRDLTGMHRAMSERMAGAGLAYADRTMTYNSRLAQELAAWAETRDGGAAIHRALFQAYFVDNRNIGQIDVLLDVASSVGLDTVQALQVLEQRSFRAQVDRDWQYSYATGITGVPAFLANNQIVVGCQPYEVLERFIRESIHRN